MSRYDLAFLMVRVAALYVAMQALDLFATGALTYDWIKMISEGAAANDVLQKYAMPSLGLLALSVALFLSTGFIARWLLLPRTATSGGGEQGVVSISPSLAFGILGMAGCLHVLPGVMDAVADLMEGTGDMEPLYPQMPWLRYTPVAGLALQGLLSLLLIFKAHALAAWWQRRDAAANSAQHAA